MRWVPWRTVRGRLVLAALLVETVMLAILVGNSLRLLHDAMGDQAHEQAEQIAPVLSAALVAPLAQYDYATVQAVLDESHAIRGIDYLAVTDAAGAIVATSGWPAGKPLPPVDANFSLNDDDSPPRYDLALPIKLAGQALGTLQFGLDLTRITVARKSLLSQGVMIALGEMLLSAGLLSLLGLLITRQLSLLTAASLKVAQGQLTLEPVPEGRDDVGRLGAAFNVMSRAIAERVDLLTRAKHETELIAGSLQEKHVALTAENAMRVQAQQELEVALGRIRERTAQLNAIFDLSPDGFVSFDATGHVTYASPAFQRMTGPGFGEPVGLSDAEFSARLGEVCVEKAQFPAVESLKPNHTAPMPLDGAVPPAQPLQPERLLIELKGPGNRVLDVRMRVAESETVSRILFFRDVTHEAEVDRMKSEFLSHAAHELRTPMASIYGFTELLRTRKMSEERRQDMLDVIHRQSLLMTSIINELLDLVRIDARRGEDFEFVSLDAAALVRAVVADFGVPAGREPAVLDLPFNPRWVRADDNKLQRAVRNIISNAYKYSAAGSDVVVSLVNGETVNAAPRVGIRVADHGIGMTPEQTARVWERFFRADASGNVPGTGLGMAIVKEIVELHGGKAEVQSEIGKGTTVTLWLPTATAPAYL